MLSRTQHPVTPPSLRNRAQGVQFPTGPEGKRSTLATGVAVFAAAAAPAGEELAGAIRKARKTWRQEYPEMLTRLVEAQSYSAQRAIAIAEAGLAEIYSTFEFVRGGEMVGVEAAMAAPSAARALHTATVAGSGALPTSLSVPYFGDSLSDQVLVDQVNAWADYGALEPAGAAALCAVAGAAGWRGLADRFARSIDEACRWQSRPSGAICAAAPSSRSAPLFVDLSQTWERHRDTRSLACGRASKQKYQPACISSHRRDRRAGPARAAAAVRRNRRRRRARQA